MKKILITFAYVLMISVMATGGLLAQLGATPTTVVRIKLSPTYPKTGEKFTASAESYSIDMDKAELTWMLDGKVVKSGFGQKNVDLVMSTSHDSLSVRAVNPSGDSFISSVPLLEKSLSIVWEGGDSYIPEWYKGKRYLANGGIMRAAAIANISDGKGYVNNEDLVFTWEINGQKQNKISGLGKYYADLNIAEVYGSDVEIKVSVKPRLSDDEISERIIISPAAPRVMLYEKDNAFGLIKRVLSGVATVNKTELQLIAEPFFFSVDPFKMNNMKYIWKINDKVQTGNTYTRVFSLGDKKGSAKISVQAEQLQKLLQKSVSDLKISF